MGRVSHVIKRETNVILKTNNFQLFSSTVHFFKSLLYECEYIIIVINIFKNIGAFYVEILTRIELFRLK